MSPTNTFQQGLLFHRGVVERAINSLGNPDEEYHLRELSSVMLFQFDAFFGIDEKELVTLGYVRQGHRYFSSRLRDSATSISVEDKRDYLSSILRFIDEQSKYIVGGGNTWRGELVAANAVKKSSLAELSTVLSSLINSLRADNAKRTVQEQLERDQLVALLKTALKILEAPLIDKGFFSHVGTQLKDAAEGAIEEQATSVTQTLIRAAIEMVRSVFGF